MATIRWIIKDHHWAKMEPYCLGLNALSGRAGSDPTLLLPPYSSNLNPIE
ncbi:MAG: hypothetical protein AAGG56_10915 [Pseudomonadota bacterium]